MPVLVEVGNEETWALESVLKHALRSAMVPDMLTKYLKKIIKLGELKSQELLIEKPGKTHVTKSAASSQVLRRLPYYRKQDVEVSIPIYKAEYAYPLILLKRLPKGKSTLVGQQRLLVLDSDGDLAVTTLPSDSVTKAQRKLDNFRGKGKEGCLICLRKPEGVSVSVMEISKLQRNALETLTQYFDESGKSDRPLSAAIRIVISKAKETILG
ncbi:hypothetical protein ACFLV3_03895 [Chloroflexota bacterium]